MLQNIVVALDGLEETEGLIPWVKVLGFQARIHLVRVLGGSIAPEMIRRSDEYLAGLASRFEGRADASTRTGTIASTILDTAKEVGADTVALASRIYDRDSVFGGTTEKLLYGSGVTVLSVPKWIAKPTSPPVIRKILIPLDGSPVSEKMFGPAAELAGLHHAEMVIAHVRWDQEKLPTAGWDRERHFRNLAETCGARVVMRHGDPGHELPAIVKAEAPDLIVMASHGMGAAQRIVLGSVSSRLIRETATPALIGKVEGLRPT